MPSSMDTPAGSRRGMPWTGPSFPDALEHEHAGRVVQGVHGLARVREGNLQIGDLTGADGVELTGDGASTRQDRAIVVARCSLLVARYSLLEKIGDG